MALDVKIPAMGESILSGVLAKWYVQDGATVKKDQPLFELETDKITSEGTAESAGRISLKVAAGTEVKIGQVVATIDAAGVSAATAAPAAPKERVENPALPQAATTAAPATGTPIENRKSKFENAPVSPAVRRLAAETGVDPATVLGTGKAGRVTKGDMIAAAPAATGQGSEVMGQGNSSPAVSGPTPGAAIPAPITPNPSPASPASARQVRRKLSPLRAKIAQRLVAAQHEAAMLTTFNEVDLSAVMALRAKYQDDFVKKNGVKLGFMSFFVKAVVHALREVPAVNVQLDGDTLIENHYFDLGVAVSTDRGLMVPVVKDCDTLGMADVEKQIAAAAVKARDGKITLADLEGGVFTITNGGTFGSLLSTPIINPPQSAILGMHAINDRPIALNGQVVIRPMMYVALSYDHRVIDGKQAVTFLVKVKQALEDPARLVIGI